MAAIWAQHRPAMLARVDVLERALAGASDGGIDPELEAQARTAAHQLAGSVGTFGYMRASELAREFGKLLREDASAVTGGASLLAGLRAELERDQVADVVVSGERPPPASGPLPLVLFVTSDAELAQRLRAEAARRGLRAETAARTADAERAMGREAPDALVVDGASVGLLGGADVPTVICAALDALPARLDAARRGAASFLGPGATPAEIVDEVAIALDARAPANGRVVAIGDVPDIAGVDLARLEPDRMVARLEALGPALVVLAHSAAGELCRVLRTDRRWAALPVVVLGQEDVPHADAVVSDPALLPGEVRRRLDRARAVAAQYGVDPQTGADSRRASARGIGRLVRLAERLEQPLCVVAITLPAADTPRLAQALRRTLRAEDVIGRWENDRLVLGMLGIVRDVAVDRLARVRTSTGIDFSAGVAQFPSDGADLEALYRAADEAQQASRDGEEIVAAGRGRLVTKKVDVAIVEDEDAAAEVIGAVLSERGHSCWRFSNGAGAVAMLAGARPQVRATVILLDLNLPAVDGLELLTLLARDGVLRASKLIVVSGNDDPAVIERTRSLGAEDYLIKPVDLPALAERVDAALGRRR